jgi:hypothetical protein
VKKDQSMIEILKEIIRKSQKQNIDDLKQAIKEHDVSQDYLI